MNDRSYFVVAVIIALVVPMIFGSIYFFKMKNLKDNTRYVTMLKDKPDIVLDGQCIINDENIDSVEREIAFSVQYVRGEADSLNYNLFFNDIEFEGTSSIIEWSLYILNDETNDYTVYSSGTIDKKTSKRKRITTNISIAFLKTQKFKLKYSTNDGNVNKFRTNIVLE